ncbi:MAG: ATP/maltotriose-dependent transcriptional regulator MalT [Myxococcota bacterium]
MTKSPKKKSAVRKQGSTTTKRTDTPTTEKVDANGASAAPEAGADTRTVRSSDVSTPDLARRLMEAAPAEQIDAALGAKKYARAADLIQRHGEPFLLDAQTERLAAWLDQLPDVHITKRPRLALLNAWLCIYTEQYQQALTRIGEAERELRSLELHGSKTPAETDDAAAVSLEPFADTKRGVRAAKAHLAWLRGDMATLTAGLGDTMLASSSDHPIWRANALLTLGRAHYMAGDLVSAAQDLDVAVTVAGDSRQRRARETLVAAQVLLGRVREAQTKLDSALELYQGVLDGTDPTKKTDDTSWLTARAGALVGVARIHLLRHDVEAAAHALAASAEQIAASKLVVVGLHGDLAAAHLRRAQGDDDASMVALARAEAFVKTHERRWAIPYVNAHRALLALGRGELATAGRWAQQVAMRGGDQIGPIKETQQVVFALVRLAQSKPGEALTSAQTALASATEGGRKLGALEAGAAAAMAYQALAKDADATKALTDALLLAAPAKIQGFFVSHGEQLMPVLARVAASKKSQDADAAAFADTLLETIGGAATRTEPARHDADAIKTGRVIPATAVVVTPSKEGPAPTETPTLAEPTVAKSVDTTESKPATSG